MTKAKNVLITGASSGFGKAIAEQFVADGYRVVGTSRSAPSETNVAAEGLAMVGLDVCSETSVNAFYALLQSQDFVPDIVVLNAGSGIGGAIEDTSTAEVVEQFEINFFGVHRLVRLLSPDMRARGSGHIIFIGSIGGRITIPFQGFYSASKAALSSYAFALRMELQPFNINVSLIEPGDHKTNFSETRKVQTSEARSAFGPAAARALEVMTIGERNGASAESLAGLVKHAAEAKYPKMVYIKGNATEWMFIFLHKILPNRVFQHLLMKTYKI